jgi:hypothetical protein
MDKPLMLGDHHAVRCQVRWRTHVGALADPIGALEL